MAALDELADRLEGFKKSGLVVDYETVVVDDSIRVRIVAPRGGDAAELKKFVVEALASFLSESQVSVEEAAE